MSRNQHLLDLIQILRRHRYPVTGAVLAEELAVSVRTLYRDIATLQQQEAQPPHSRRLYALMRIFFG